MSESAGVSLVGSIEWNYQRRCDRVRLGLEDDGYGEGFGRLRDAVNMSTLIRSVGGTCTSDQLTSADRFSPSPSPHHQPIPPSTMPVSPASLPPPQQDLHSQPQIKLCSSCRSPLTQDLDATSAHFFADSDVNDLMMCYPCKERYLLQSIQQQAHELAAYRDAVDEPHRLHQHPVHPAIPLAESPPTVQPPPLCPLPSKVQHEALVSSAPSKRAKLALVVSDGPRSTVSSAPSVPSSIRSDISPLQHSPTPDPYIDITRIRMRSQGHHCLYPGATFQGTQKSGRNSYDVTVSIVVGRSVSLSVDHYSN